MSEENSHKTKFSVIRRNPPLPGDPEWMVYEGGLSMASAVAIFFNEMDARDYAKLRNKGHRE